MSQTNNPAPDGWKLVPLEPTPEIIAGAAIAAWPTASQADIALARRAAPLVLMQMDLAPGASVDLIAGMLATMAPAYRAMLAAAPSAPASADNPSTAGAEAIIDSPEFMELLCSFYEQSSCEEFNEAAYNADRRKLVEFISDRLAAPVAQSTAGAAKPVDHGHVLRVLRQLLDGSQPEDVPAAIMVIDHALANGIAWTYDITPPEGFVSYVKANYNGDVNFYDPEWHATRIWNAAMKNAGARLAAPALNPSEVRDQALAALKTISEFPVTDLIANMDAWNMKNIAIRAIKAADQQGALGEKGGE